MSECSLFHTIRSAASTSGGENVRPQLETITTTEHGIWLIRLFLYPIMVISAAVTLVPGRHRRMVLMAVGVVVNKELEKVSIAEPSTQRSASSACPEYRVWQPRFASAFPASREVPEAPSAIDNPVPMRDDQHGNTFHNRKVSGRKNCDCNAPYA